MTLAALPERFPGRTIGALGALFALLYGVSLILIPKTDGRIVVGDALHHYVQLRSAVFDRDLHFQNEYIRMYGLTREELGTEWVFWDLTPTSHVRNYMPVGPALLWTPAFLLAAAGVAMANAAGAAYPLDGYGRVFQATAGLTGAAAAAAGVWFSFRAAQQLFSTRHAVWASIVFWLSSSAIYYSLISPAYSHAASMFATGAFWYAFVAGRDRSGLARYSALGALAGLAALMRWQDAVLLGAVATDLLWRVRAEHRLRDLCIWGAAAAAAAFVVFAPQLYVWQVLYGRPFAIPQGPGFMLWSHPALDEVMVSTWRGLLTWTPITLAGLLGLLALFRREPMTAVSAVLVFCVSWYVNAAAADWWAGEAFGARRFISCFPIFVLGLAAALQAWSPRLGALATVSGVIVAHTFLLLLQYQAYMKGLREIVPYPKGMYELWLARFRVPFDLLRWWIDR